MPPTQSDLFQNFQQAVWDDNIHDADGNNLYDNYENAIQTASIFNAKQTNTSQDGEWSEFLFPDGSTCWIANNGAGTSEASQ